MFARSAFARPAFFRNAPRALAAAVASGLILGASAQANEVKTVDTTNGRVQRSIEVRFVDLDLTTEQGAATLETRLRNAARLVCGDATSSTLREQMDRKACINETLASGKRAMVTLIARAEAGDRFQPGERIAVGS